MASFQCLDGIGFPVLLHPRLVGGLYAALAAVATRMRRCCELRPAELTMLCVSDLVHTFFFVCLVKLNMSHHVAAIHMVYHDVLSIHNFTHDVTLVQIGVQLVTRYAQLLMSKQFHNYLIINKKALHKLVKDLYT